MLEAAQAVVAARGLDALTIRAVAARLDVAPNALYGWVAGKADLLDALVDDVLPQELASDEDGDPRRAVHDLLLQVFDAMSAHPDLAPLHLSRRYSPGPNASALRTRLEELLRAGGAAPADVRAAVPVLVINTIGFAAYVHQTAGGAALLPSHDPDGARTVYARGVDWLISGALGDTRRTGAGTAD